MALSDDSAAIAAATLTTAAVQAAGATVPGKNRDETVGHVMDIYRRSLNVIRNAAEAPRPKK